MSERSAVVLVCDELSVSLNGKFNIAGLYSTEILIPTNPTTVNQLVFLLLIETGVEEPFRSLSVEISLPGSAPVRQDLPPVPDIPHAPDRTRINFRWPFLISQVVLRPGHIGVKVIHENGEIDASGAPWIFMAIQPTPPAASSS
jgi:hypothetical protein